MSSESWMKYWNSFNDQQSVEQPAISFFDPVYFKEKYYFPPYIYNAETPSKQTKLQRHIYTHKKCE